VGVVARVEFAGGTGARRVGSWRTQGRSVRFAFAGFALGSLGSLWVRGGFAGGGGGSMGWRARLVWEGEAREFCFLRTFRCSRRRSSAAVGAVRTRLIREPHPALLLGGVGFCRIPGRDSSLEAKAPRHGPCAKASGSSGRPGDGDPGVRFCPVAALPCPFPRLPHPTPRLGPFSPNKARSQENRE
jgi:hypothetical protein